MKLRIVWGIALLFVSGALAQTTPTEAKEIPAETGEPPYEVGELLDDKGYTIEREEQPDLNFRIVNNRIRLYWIDEDRLIVEPDADEAVVRFRGSVRGRSYHRLKPLSEDTGLGAVGILPPPHILDTILIVGRDTGGEPVSHFFRYTPEMAPKQEDYGSTTQEEGSSY